MAAAPAIHALAAIKSGAFNKTTLFYLTVEPKTNRRLPPHHRPARVQVGLVVLVFPGRAAAVAAVAGDRDQAVAARLMAVVALHQLGVARGLAPVALNAGAGVAEHYFVRVSRWF